jgi:hypothetical protein
MQTLNYHNVRDNKGRFSSKKGKSTPTAKLITHYLFLLDYSGSMNSCYNTAKQTVIDLANSINRESSKNPNLVNYFSVIPFSTKASVTKIKGSEVDILDLPSRTADSTALNDALDLSFDTIGGYEPNTAYNITVITDGQENVSRCSLDRITRRKTISKLYGVPEGCINEWENTVVGTQTMATTNSVAATGYVIMRSAGGSSTAEYFKVDATNFKGNITRLKPISVKHRKVEKECSIEEFFGKDFVLGTGYYELTKTEKIQTHKNIIIQDKATGQYYGSSMDMSVRQFLGINSTRDYKIDPFNVGHYRIFIQSTSNNRKLVRGSTVIWM